MTLAIFDLDNTLIAGDSDHAWGDFLAARGIVDGDHYKAQNDRFYQDYLAGRLDIQLYLAFALKVLTEHPPARLHALREEFMRECVEPILLPKAFDLLAEHRARGEFLLIITATNDFVTAPIAERLGVDALIATTAEFRDGRYTGRCAGTPCFREGKVTRLREWLAAHPGHDPAQASFYSDSHNDIPLLSLVGRPVAVDPDTALRAHALAHGWPVLSLR